MYSKEDIGGIIRSVTTTILALSKTLPGVEK